MTAKEYLRQAYRLDHRINSYINEAARLRHITQGARSPSMEPHYDPNTPTEASFAKILMKLFDMEEKINNEIDRLVDLKAQIKTVIDEVRDIDEQTILRYRYLDNYTWEKIGKILHVDESTVRRWHGRALQNVKLPDDAIEI